MVDYAFIIVAAAYSPIYVLIVYCANFSYLDNTTYFSALFLSEMRPAIPDAELWDFEIPVSNSRLVFIEFFFCGIDAGYKLYWCWMPLLLLLF